MSNTKSQHTMSPKQLETLSKLVTTWCMPITSCDIHPYSGAMTLKRDNLTLAIVESDGNLSYMTKEEIR